MRDNAALSITSFLPDDRMGIGFENENDKCVLSGWLPPGTGTFTVSPIRSGSKVWSCAADDVVSTSRAPTRSNC